MKHPNSNKEKFSLEQQLFTWENWDQTDTFNFYFHGVQLLVPIGSFPVGSKFTAASFNGEDSILTLISDQKDHMEEYSFQLHISVGEQLSTQKYC